MSTITSVLYSSTSMIGPMYLSMSTVTRKLRTVVKSCDAAQITTVINGKKEKIPGYEVTLDDTILFPEGGGQRENNIWDDGGLSDEECGNVVVSPAVLLSG
ncbi:hypothetical protein LSH36_1560g00030 [Paralvinella palmiformis]|uniref:Uncharacterized protein n=1 Tax=Paralvinella palmiformis TaxID=53620 RepID=A0AAD9MQ04_9ANNE|nr:hypothetical protein LSH36_1560g00030 [Paralvinella palmiformis]